MSETTTYASDEFWAAYAEYTNETRPQHRRMVNALLHRRPLGMVVDLGCGRTKEGQRLFNAKHYLGVDADPAANAVLTHDYRDIEGLRLALEHPKFTDIGRPSTFVSLFSTELTASPEANAAFYIKLFEKFPSLVRGVVAGFYYSCRRSEVKVSEAGGIESYQSIGDLSVSLRETRVLMRVPSKLFGDDVVEVWRLLEHVR